MCQTAVNETKNKTFALHIYIYFLIYETSCFGDFVFNTNHYTIQGSCSSTANKFLRPFNAESLYLFFNTKKDNNVINTFQDKQNHTFTKIYKLQNRINTKKFSSTTADSEWCSAVNAVTPDMQRIRQSCIKIGLQEKLTFIHITYIMPFKTSRRNFSKFKTFLRP